MNKNGFTSPSRGTSEVGVNTQRVTEAQPFTLRHPELVSGSINANVKNRESGSKSKALLKKIGGLEGWKIGYLRRASHADNSLPSYHPTFLSSKLAPTPALPHGGGKRAAFTLAEVLITLGIIGVVAALTLPTLIQQHRKTAVETSLAKFYSTISQAVKMAEVNYGDVTQWDTYESLYEKDEDGKKDRTKPIPNTEYFNKYFAPYLNTLKVESINGTNIVAAYFTDGSLATFDSTAIKFYPKAKDFRNNDNSGTTYFVFFISPGNLIASDTRYKYHYGKGVEPYKYNWNGTKEQLINDSYYGCKKESVFYSHAYCTALIQQNGWKIPSDYPLKF